MSLDEEKRRAEREEHDALSAVRLAAMEKRLGRGPRMFPVTFSKDHALHGSGASIGAGAKGWLLQFVHEDRHGLVAVISMETGTLSRWFPPRDGGAGTTEVLPIPRGFLVSVPVLSSLQFDSVRIDEWFLDGGSQ